MMRPGTDEVADLNELYVDDTVEFVNYSEKLPRLLGIVMPFWYAVRYHECTPLFERIFHPIPVTTKNKESRPSRR